MKTPWDAPQAWRFIAALLSSPGLGVLVPTERHAEVAEQVIREIPQLTGNLFHDAHTADFDAGAWYPPNLHPRYRFPSVSVSRSF